MTPPLSDTPLCERDFAAAYQRMDGRLDDADRATLNMVIRMAKVAAREPLERELASLRERDAKDAERLDWLDGPDRHLHRREHDLIRSDPCRERCVTFYVHGVLMRADGATAREAIDNAMAIYAAATKGLNTPPEHPVCGKPRLCNCGEPGAKWCYCPMRPDRE